MIFLIADEQIVGTAIGTEFQLPDGWQAIDGPDYPIEEAYWDGEVVQVRPDRPSPEHEWDQESHIWIAPSTAPPVAQIADWDGLVNGLRGTPIFGKIYTAATQPDANTIAALTKTMQANTAYTLLMDTLTKTHNLQDLEWALGQLRGAMATISTVGDFDADEVEWLNNLLAEKAIDLQLENPNG